MCPAGKVSHYRNLGEKKFRLNRCSVAERGFDECDIMLLMNNITGSFSRHHGGIAVDEQQENQQHDRLRPAPVERFAGEIHVFDLNEALQKLRAEAHAAESGHRQMTIFHRAPVAKVLFAIEPGGELAEHTANGLVTIHALEGHLTVQAAEQTHQLEAGMIVILSPNVRHSVRASEASAMLLTVHMENEK
jgi:quercetin dioxygenase-like cupin family protein